MISNPDPTQEQRSLRQFASTQHERHCGMLADPRRSVSRARVSGPRRAGVDRAVVGIHVPPRAGLLGGRPASPVW
jgi:hypothetical protein